MKKIILFAILLFTFACNSYSQTSMQWQSDLRFLQSKVHSDYSNLFYNITAADWDKAVDDLYSKIPGMDKYQIEAGFVELIASFKIGHTRINTGALMQDSLDQKLHTVPYQLYKFSDGVYILRADNKYEQAVGGKVIRIGNKNTDEALESIRPLVSYENEQGFISNSMYFLTIPEFLKTQGIIENSNEVPITYLKNGKEETVKFETGTEIPAGTHGSTGLVTPPGWTEARKEGDYPLWLKEPASFRYMEYLPESKILYVRHSAVLDDGDNTIESFFSKVEDYIEMNDVQKLVLDLRMNGGGNNYLNKSVIKTIIKSEKINQPGKFYCIIGRRTFSAAQNLVNELENYTEVIFAGEPTSENVNFYGDAKTVTLQSSKLQARLSWLWWQNKDPRDKRTATFPALAVDMSFDDYYNNVDPVMNVVTASDGKVLLDAELKELVESGNMDGALVMANEYIKDPVHRYYISELEDKINLYGYTLMGEKKFQEANKILGINVQLFPESANAYDSYAESFWKLGNTEEALKYYDMAIAKDKNGATAENSRKMIDQIKKSN